MSNKGAAGTAVVDGEASESGSEIDDASTASTFESKAFVVSGEAPESDEEDEVKEVKLQETVEPETAPVEVAEESPDRERHRSLLHRKLYESNMRLRSTAEQILLSTCQAAGARLSSANNSLLSAQESLRSSNSNLTLARARLKQVKAALERCDMAAALPTVKSR